VKITRFEDVEAWKEARVLVSMVYESTGKEPFKKDWGLKIDTEFLFFIMCYSPSMRS
jgi:hypothetical protein